jgi:hypothetical protein
MLELVQGSRKSREHHANECGELTDPRGDYGPAEESGGENNRRGNNESLGSFSQQDEHSSPGREEEKAGQERIRLNVGRDPDQQSGSEQ